MSNFFNSLDFRLTDLKLLSPQRVMGHNRGVVNLDIVIKWSLTMGEKNGSKWSLKQLFRRWHGRGKSEAKERVDGAAIDLDMIMNWSLHAILKWQGNRGTPNLFLPMPWNLQSMPQVPLHQLQETSTLQPSSPRLIRILLYLTVRSRTTTFLILLTKMPLQNK